MEESLDLTVDLGKYIETLLRQWRLIVAATLLCAFTAGLVSVLLPKQYRARALVATTKVTSAISFGSSIQTISEEQLLASGAGAYRMVDPELRLQSYVQLVANPAVAQKVLDELGDRLAEDERTVTELLEMVEGEVAERSDAIRISVTYKDPALAAEIANAWARAYVERLNAIYSSGATDESYAAVKQQTASAQADYEGAQNTLLAFIAENRKDELNRKISELQVIIDNLSEARGTAVNAIVNEQTQAQLQVIKEYYNAQTQNQLLALRRDQQGRQELITTYINTLNAARQKVFDEHAQDRLSNLSRYYTEARHINKLLDDARDMRAQVAGGGAGAAASNSLALTLLKAQAYADNGGLSESLQLQISPAVLSPEAMLADLDALIAALEARQAIIQEDIQSLSQDFLQGDGFEFLDVPLESSGALAQTIQQRYPELFQTGDLAGLSLKVIAEGSGLSDEAQRLAESLLKLEGQENLVELNVSETPIEQKIQELEQQVRDLQAQLAEQEGREKELARARDLAWETYKNLATKEAELGVAVQTTGTEVALAAPAAAPEKDIVSGAKNTLLAALVGLMLGVFAAYAIEFWWAYKGLEPEPVTLGSLRKSRQP